jgi:hypothetical protein
MPGAAGRTREFAIAPPRGLDDGQRMTALRQTVFCSLACSTESLACAVASSAAAFASSHFAAASAFRALDKAVSVEVQAALAAIASDSAACAAASAASASACVAAKAGWLRNAIPAARMIARIVGESPDRRSEFRCSCKRGSIQDCDSPRRQPSAAGRGSARNR